MTSLGTPDLGGAGQSGIRGRQRRGGDRRFATRNIINPSALSTPGLPVGRFADVQRRDAEDFARAIQGLAGAASGLARLRQGELAERAEEERAIEEEERLNFAHGTAVAQDELPFLADEIASGDFQGITHKTTDDELKLILEVMTADRTSEIATPAGQKGFAAAFENPARLMLVDRRADLRARQEGLNITALQSQMTLQRTVGGVQGVLEVAESALPSLTRDERLNKLVVPRLNDAAALGDTETFDMLAPFVEDVFRRHVANQRIELETSVARNESADQTRIDNELRSSISTVLLEDNPNPDLIERQARQSKASPGAKLQAVNTARAIREEQRRALIPDVQTQVTNALAQDAIDVQGEILTAPRLGGLSGLGDKEILVKNKDGSFSRKVLSQEDRQDAAYSVFKAQLAADETLDDRQRFERKAAVLQRSPRLVDPEISEQLNFGLAAAASTLTADELRGTPDGEAAALAFNIFRELDRRSPDLARRHIEDPAIFRIFEQAVSVNEFDPNRDPIESILTVKRNLESADPISLTERTGVDGPLRKALEDAGLLDKITNFQDVFGELRAETNMIRLASRVSPDVAVAKVIEGFLTDYESDNGFYFRRNGLPAPEDFEAVSILVKDFFLASQPEMADAVGATKENLVLRPLRNNRFSLAIRDLDDEGIQSEAEGGIALSVFDLNRISIAAFELSEKRNDIKNARKTREQRERAIRGAVGVQRHLNVLRDLRRLSPSSRANQSEMTAEDRFENRTDFFRFRAKRLPAPVPEPIDETEIELRVFPQDDSQMVEIIRFIQEGPDREKVVRERKARERKQRERESRRRSPLSGAGSSS